MIYGIPLWVGGRTSNHSGKGNQQQCQRIETTGNRPTQKRTRVSRWGKTYMDRFQELS